MGEQLCTFYANHFDVEVVVLRPFNVFGSGQDPRFLIPSIISQAKVSSEIRVLDSRPSRDYIFVDDLVDAVVKAMSADVKFDIFNIGTGISHSVSDLINLLGDIVGQEFRITSLSQERFGEINSTRADISKAQRVLNWYPNWELKAGLERVWKESI